MISVPKASDGTLDAGRYWLSLPFTGTSDWIQLPANMVSVSVGITPAAGQTARIEHTLSSAAEINAGTAIWAPWDLGNVSATATDSLLTTAAAIRGVSSGGTATLQIAAR